jgi:hypothetical protein
MWSIFGKFGTHLTGISGQVTQTDEGSSKSRSLKSSKGSKGGKGSKDPTSTLKEDWERTTVSSLRDAIQANQIGTDEDIDIVVCDSSSVYGQKRKGGTDVTKHYGVTLPFVGALDLEPESVYQTPTLISLALEKHHQTAASMMKDRKLWVSTAVGRRKSKEIEADSNSL